MITICQISQLKYANYDEVWAIVRSLKYANPNIRHVPELSPSWKLFCWYRQMKEEGRWNEETFQKVYVPQFLKEMRGEKQQKLLNDLAQTKKHIALVCFCMEEEVCHRSIIGGMLQGAGVEVAGLARDCSYYYNWWKYGIPGSDTTPDMQEKEEHIFEDDLPTMCFTGRRPKDLCGWQTEKYSAFVTDLSELIYEKFHKEQGIRRFITGGAQGFDQMAFWAVERMKKTHQVTGIQNVIFIPFKGQEEKWAEKGCFSQKEYRQMLKVADRTVVIGKENTMEAFLMRNHRMCDHSKLCLGLYPDSEWKDARGGTAECMRYAKEKPIPVFQLQYRIDGTGLHMGDLLVV